MLPKVFAFQRFQRIELASGRRRPAAAIVAHSLISRSHDGNTSPRSFVAASFPDIAAVTKKAVPRRSRRTTSTCNWESRAVKGIKVLYHWSDRWHGHLHRTDGSVKK